MMYMNLRAEMVRSNIDMFDIANHLSVRYATVCDKMNGKYRFYYDEALAIKNMFFPEYSLEYLFESQENKSAKERGAIFEGAIRRSKSENI